MEQPTTDEILKAAADVAACADLPPPSQSPSLAPSAPATIRRADVQGLFGLMATSLVTASLLSLLPTLFADSSNSRKPITTAESTGFVVDVNSATVAELDLLPQVGRVLAERIVREREQRGSFKSLDDLVRTPGLGQVRLDRLRPLLTAGPSTVGQSSLSRDATPDDVPYQAAKPPLDLLKTTTANTDQAESTGDLTSE